MCSVIIARNCLTDWPVMIAANRDEMLDRPWQPPARHWPDRQEVIAGLDELAGGTWLGLNDFGVVATILNRQHTLGPATGKRSRGELVLEALDHADAAAAIEALLALDAGAYRPFNMLIADNRHAAVLIGRGEGAVERAEIPDGVSMITHADLNDRNSARIGTYLPAFQTAVLPNPAADDWAGWVNILGARDADNPVHGMNIPNTAGFGTGSSALVALPSIDQAVTKPIFKFAAGAPDVMAFVPVDDLCDAKTATMQQAIV